MTWLLLLILVCFLIVAFKAFLDWHTWVAVAKGLVPNIPANLPVAGTDPVQFRSGFTQLMSIAGQALPASVFLAYGYFTANANYKAVDLKASFKKTVINMGIIWGAFSVVVVVAGYYALNLVYQGTGAPGDLHYSQISTVPQAGMVLAPAMPGFMGFLAYRIFSLGLFAAAFTTLLSVAMIDLIARKLVFELALNEIPFFPEIGSPEFERTFLTVPLFEGNGNIQPVIVIRFLQFAESTGGVLKIIVEDAVIGIIRRRSVIGV